MTNLQTRLLFNTFLAIILLSNTIPKNLKVIYLQLIDLQQVAFAENDFRKPRSAVFRRFSPKTTV